MRGNEGNDLMRGNGERKGGAITAPGPVLCA